MSGLVKIGIRKRRNLDRERLRLPKRQISTKEVPPRHKNGPVQRCLAIAAAGSAEDAERLVISGIP